MSQEYRRARAPAPEHVQFLRQRSAELAEREAEIAVVATEPFVTFRLADEDFALAARVVVQVGVLRELTPLPGAPPPWFGVTHWRGDALVVLDLREMLGARTRGITDLSRIIVVEGPDHDFALIADAAHEIRSLDAEQIHAPLGRNARAPELIRGVTPDAITVLDAERLVQRFGGLSVAGQQAG